MHGERSVAIVSSLALLLVAAPVAAQDTDPPRIEVRGVQPLVSDPPPHRQVETYLAVNPDDPSIMIATALADSVDGGLAYVTRDGGDDWTLVEGPGDPVFPGGDPMISFGGDGRAYLSTLASGFTVWRSSDGGRSWSGPAEVEGTIDRQWVVATPSPEDEPGPVFAAGRAGDQPGSDVAVWVSRDGGRTFSESARITPEGEILNAVSDLFITKGDTILIPYLGFVRTTDGGNERVQGKRRVLISPDGGETWSGPHPVGEQRISTDVAGQAANRLMLGVGGAAVDESGGRFDGTAYLVWTSVIDGYLQPVLARSRDGGRGWSEAIRVNRAGHEAHHSTAHVAVGPEGVVAVSWNDRRHDPEHQCYHHYVAVSHDGGRTFSEETRVSERETCLPSGYRYQNGGDTQGLVALPNGGFRLVWSGPGPHGPQPWTAAIEVQ